MFGLNWIDLVIIVMLLASIWAGLKLGLVNQLLVIISFLSAFFALGWLLPRLLPIHDRTLKTIINSNLVLLLSAYAAIKGYDFSRRVHWRYSWRPLNTILKKMETILGIVPAMTGGLLIIWLLAAMFSRMPFAGLSNSINSSKIVLTLNTELPSVPRFVAIFDRRVNPNAEPYIFAQPSPSRDFNYSSGQVSQAAQLARNSTVRITSFGCGGIVSGSGFVVAPDLVMTNAHVVAGVKRPIVKYQSRSLVATPVLFDPSHDIAVLRLNNFQAASLQLENQPTPLGTSVAILGYPSGNYTIAPGIIRNNLAVPGRDIYDVGLFVRRIYEIQTLIDLGSSGSPVVTAHGRVVGMILSKASQPPNYAFAITADDLKAPIAQTTNAHQRVGTGPCLAN